MFFISVATTYRFATLTLKLSTKNWENRRSFVITSRRCYTISIFYLLHSLHTKFEANRSKNTATPAKDAPKWTF